MFTEELQWKFNSGRSRRSRRTREILARTKRQSTPWRLRLRSSDSASLLLCDYRGPHAMEGGTEAGTQEGAGARGRRHVARRRQGLSHRRQQGAGSLIPDQRFHATEAIEVAAQLFVFGIAGLQIDARVVRSGVDA